MQKNYSRLKFNGNHAKYKLYIKDEPCRSIHAPLNFNTIDTSIGKVYYHFAEKVMEFKDAKDYCATMGFNVNLPMPKEDSIISRLHPNYLDP